VRMPKEKIYMARDVRKSFAAAALKYSAIFAVTLVVVC
jgi:hypothetical protein